MNRMNQEAKFFFFFLIILWKSLLAVPYCISVNSTYRYNTSERNSSCCLNDSLLADHAATEMRNVSALNAAPRLTHTHTSTSDQSFAQVMYLSTGSLMSQVIAWHDFCTMNAKTLIRTELIFFVVVANICCERWQRLSVPTKFLGWFFLNAEISFELLTLCYS